MAVYAVSFELASDTGYAARYASLMEQIRKSDFVWEETTSFAFCRTNESLATFADRLYDRSLVLKAKDKLLVFNPTSGAGFCWGPLRYEATLKLLMPTVAYLK